MHTRLRAAGYIAALATGCVLGVIGARVLFVGSALSLIPWALVGLSVGAMARSAGIAAAAAAGALYGFGLGFSFMIAGYSGSAALVSRLVPFSVFGAIGAVCGACLSALGARLSRRPQNRGHGGLG